MLNKKLDVLSVHELKLLNEAYNRLRVQLMMEEECDLYIPCTMCQYYKLCHALKATMNAITNLIDDKCLREQKLYRELNKY